MPTATGATSSTMQLRVEDIVGALTANLNPFLSANRVTIRSPVDDVSYVITELRNDGYFVANVITGDRVDTAIHALPCNPYFLGLVLNQWSDFSATAPDSITRRE